MLHCVTKQSSTHPVTYQDLSELSEKIKSLKGSDITSHYESLAEYKILSGILLTLYLLKVIYRKCQGKAILAGLTSFEFGHFLLISYLCAKCFDIFYSFKVRFSAGGKICSGDYLKVSDLKGQAWE